MAKHAAENQTAGRTAADGRRRPKQLGDTDDAARRYAALKNKARPGAKARRRRSEAAAAAAEAAAAAAAVEAAAAARKVEEAVRVRGKADEYLSKCTSLSLSDAAQALGPFYYMLGRQSLPNAPRHRWARGLCGRTHAAGRRANALAARRARLAAAGRTLADRRFGTKIVSP